MKDVKEQWKEFVDKFSKYFEEILEESDRKFLTSFQAWFYILDNMSNEQIVDCLPEFVCKVFRYDEKNTVVFFKTVIDVFKDNIIEQVEKSVDELFITRNISQGEAMIVVDNAFEKDYFPCFQMSLVAGLEGLRELQNEKGD